jgi:hypothetical protein
MNATTTLTIDAALEIANGLYAEAKGGEIDMATVVATLAPLSALTVPQMRAVCYGFKGFAEGRTKKAMLQSIADDCWKRGYLVSRNNWTAAY